MASGPTSSSLPSRSWLQPALLPAPWVQGPPQLPVVGEQTPEPGDVHGPTAALTHHPYREELVGWGSWEAPTSQPRKHPCSQWGMGLVAPCSRGKLVWFLGHTGSVQESLLSRAQGTTWSAGIEPGSLCAEQVPSPLCHPSSSWELRQSRKVVMGRCSCRLGQRKPKGLEQAYRFHTLSGVARWSLTAWEP